METTLPRPRPRRLWNQASDIHLPATYPHSHEQEATANETGKQILKYNLEKRLVLAKINSKAKKTFPQTIRNIS